MSAPLHGALAARVFASFAFAYFLSYALRAVNAAIAPQLVADLGLSRTDLGALTGAYLLAFACMQLPLGELLDRYGARRVEAVLVGIAAIGCAVFAAAESLQALWLGRALIGLGVSACLMGAFKGFRHWFPADRQSRLTLWMVTAGASGAIAMTVPAQRLVDAMGWRALFWGLAVAVAASAVAVWFGLPRAPEENRRAGGDARGPERDRDAPSPAPAADSAPVPAARLGYRTFLGDPYFWRIAMLSAVYQGVFIAMQTLWLGPWLTDGLGLAPARAAEVLLGFNVMQLVATLSLGSIVPRIERSGWPMSRLLAASNVAMLAAMTAGTLLDGNAAWLPWMAFAALSTFNLVGQSHISNCYPIAIAGRAATSYNLTIFAVGFALQAGVGVLADAFGEAGDGRADALRHAFWVVEAIMAALWIGFVALRAQPRRADAPAMQVA